MGNVRGDPCICSGEKVEGIMTNIAAIFLYITRMMFFIPTVTQVMKFTEQLK
jgi:hypothetical protein